MAADYGCRGDEETKETSLRWLCVSLESIDAKYISQLRLQNKYHQLGGLNNRHLLSLSVNRVCFF